MFRKYYTDEDIIRHAAKVTSMAQLLHCLGLKSAGGNYTNMKRKLQILKVDCNHWTGTSWNRGQRLKDWSEYTKAKHCKPHLIKSRGHICENCKLTTWLDQKITLELHHIDSDRTNNEYSNLMLLCPNCHSQTKSWRRYSGGYESRTRKQ